MRSVSLEEADIIPGAVLPIKAECRRSTRTRDTKKNNLKQYIVLNVSAVSHSRFYMRSGLPVQVCWRSDVRRKSSDAQGRRTSRDAPAQ